MKTVKQAVAAVILILSILLLIGHVLTTRGQADTQSTADAILQPVAPENVPDSGTFYYLSDYLNWNDGQGGSLGPPWPFLKDTNEVVYWLKGNAFLVDDTAGTFTNDAQALQAMATLLQPRDAFSSNLLSETTAMDSADDIDPNDYTNSAEGGGSNTYSPSVVTYPSNVLWIQVPANSLAVPAQFGTVLQNTTPDEPYDVLTSTNLSLPLSQWTVEQSVPGLEGTNCTPVALMMNGRSNLFVTARFGGSSDGSGLPDWWEALYFPGATNGVDPYAQDPSGDGWNILDDFLNGWVPGSWHIPPPPQNFSVHLDSTGTNIVLTWQTGGGPVDHYEIDEDYNGSPYDVGEVNNDTLTFTDDNTFDVIDPLPRRVVAVFTNGDTSPTDWKWPVLDRSATIFRGTGGQYYVALPNAPQNLMGIKLIWGEFPPQTIEYMDATNLVNGVFQIPQDHQLDIAQGDYSFFLQLVDSNTNSSDYITPRFAMYPEHQLGIATAVTNFANAAAQMKENLRFLLRSAGVLWPFSYSSGIRFDPGTGIYQDIPDPRDINTPERCFARGPAITNYGYYGFHTYSSNLNFSFTDELRPVAENLLWRNFVYDPVDFTNGNLDSDLGLEGLDNGASLSTVYDAKYQYTGTGTETPLPLAFDLSNSGWLYFPTYFPYDSANIGSSPTTNQFFYTLDNGATNIYGLALQSAYDETNFVQLGSTFAAGGFTLMYEDFTAPDLQIVDYYFNSQTPFFNYTWSNGYTGPAPALPGSPTFSTTNTSPLLITGIGQPITVSGWAKMAITNGDPNKFGYLEQYFDFCQPYTTDTNSPPPTNSVGLLSPYGDFFPTMPGPAALVTMPDIDSGQRGTSVVNVIKLQLDVNHDGTMDLSFGGPDNTSQAHPFEFWINNDNDGTGVGKDSDPKGRTNLMDYTHGQIRSERNLEDFARLWICGMPALPFGCNVVLSFANTQGSPAINIYYANETNGDISYLTDTNVANAQVNESFYGSKLGTVSTNQNYAVPLLGGFEGPLAYTNFLFEGAGIGSGELVLTVWQGTNILARTSQWIDLHDPKDFFEHSRASGVSLNDPPTTNAGAFTIDSYEIVQSVLEDKQIIIFVHGANNTQFVYENSNEAIFKRLYWQGYHGRYTAFRWPSPLWSLTPISTNQVGYFNYNKTEYIGWQSGAALKNYIDNLRVRFPGYTVNVCATSGGGVVANEAIRFGAQVDNYAMVLVTLPAGAFDGDNPSLIYDYLATGGPNTPDADALGGYNNCFTNATRRVNFYNDDDYACFKGPLGTGESGWEAIQKLTRPAQSFSAPGWDYYFDGTNCFHETTDESGQTLNTRMLTQDYEKKSYVARSRTKAIGAAGLKYTPYALAGGVISTNISVQDPNLGFIGGAAFGDSRDDHSGEFTKQIQNSTPLYFHLMKEGFHLQPTQNP